MIELATIGYQGAALSDFLAALRAHRVRILVDVREAPVSRKQGFSKKVLAAALEEAGIGYVHLRGLGTPKAGRDLARAGDRAGFERIFHAHMETERFRDDLREAAAVAGAGGACLMCYERDPDQCHRTIVAARLADAHGFRVRHLMAGEEETEARQLALPLGMLRRKN